VATDCKVAALSDVNVTANSRQVFWLMDIVPFSVQPVLVVTVQAKLPLEELTMRSRYEVPMVGAVLRAPEKEEGPDRDDAKLEWLSFHQHKTLPRVEADSYRDPMISAAFVSKSGSSDAI
jgi:hypothetical protein